MGVVGTLLGSGKRKAGRAYKKGLMNLMGARSEATNLRSQVKNTSGLRFIKKTNLKNKSTKAKNRVTNANADVKGLRDTYNDEAAKTTSARRKAAGGAGILALGGGAYKYDKAQQAGLQKQPKPASPPKPPGSGRSINYTF